MSGPEIVNANWSPRFNADTLALALVHVALGLACLMAVYRAWAVPLAIRAWAAWKRSRGARNRRASLGAVTEGAVTDMSLTVEQGEPRMTALYTMYGFATVALGLAVQSAETATGFKAALILVDYLALSGLFFFSSWFRNRWLFRLLRRISTDSAGPASLVRPAR